MDTMIAYCGLDCSQCPAFIARQDGNDDLRRTTALEWSEQFHIDITPAAIDCSGCRAPGVHNPFCGTCAIRACGMERGVANCAHCPDYGCEKLLKIFAADGHCKNRLDEIRRWM